MTDALLRRPVRDAPPRAADLGLPGMALSRAATAARSLAVPTVPAHVAVMLGLSTAGYGLLLAAVTTLQSASEAGLSAARAPVQTAIADVALAHDQLSRRLAAAGRSYTDTAAAYDALIADIARVETTLGALADGVTAVDGAARALPASVRLPPVVRSIASSGRSTTHATTGGSAAP